MPASVPKRELPPGIWLAPGFIDAHTHDDRLLLSDRDVTPKASQGVTTVITGNCGISLAHSPAPHGAPTPPLDLLDDEGGWFRFPSFRAYRETLEAEPPAINAACLVGHTSFRVAAMDRLDRVATEAEIARMRAMAHEALASGAIGVSTGTAYQPAACASTEDIIEVCRPLTEFGGLYVTHMRNEDDAITDAMEETFAIGRALSAPVVLSHHKCVGTRNHGRSPETLDLIEKQKRTQRVALDCYPYIASSTVLRADRLETECRKIRQLLELVDAREELAHALRRKRQDLRSRGRSRCRGSASLTADTDSPPRRCRSASGRSSP